MKILSYPKPHVIKVPDNWNELTPEEQVKYLKDYWSKAHVEYDAFDF